MPISADNTRLSIDFGYEYEAPSGEALVYQMKYMHTDQGPCVQISNGPYEPIELPAAMFVEVAEFLISQGVIKGAKPPLSAAPQVGATKGPLAVPTIFKRGSLPTPGSGLPASGSNNLPTPVESLSNGGVVDEETEEAKAKAAQILAERAAAKKQASTKKEERKIKSDHRAKD